jgi:UDP-3-O-[3-hydroxymyristoyl] N-acetylglucosamine deacetylase
MSILNQKTVNSNVTFEGIGLHTGINSKITIKPSSPNSGIIFRRIDLKKNNIVYPNIFNVSNAVLCTTISNEHNVKISTIEHLMAALYGLGIDNAEIDINAQEVPILDGSAKIFVDKILEVGIKNSDVPIKIIKIEKKVQTIDKNKSILIEPSKISLEIDFEINFKNKFINTQRNSVNVYQDDLSKIYESRTFCLYEDIENLKKAGFAKGGSLDNAIVVKDSKILNDDGLRNKLEFVNHKILDCIGDLYLSGYKMISKISCSQGGHYLTNQLLRKVFSDKSNYSLIELKGKTVPQSLIYQNHLKSIA